MAELRSLWVTGGEVSKEGKCQHPSQCKKVAYFSPEGKDIYYNINNCTIIHRNINSSFNMKTNRKQKKWILLT